MIATTHIRAQVLFLMVAALAAAGIVSQLLVSFITSALHDSQSVRVSSATACAVQGDSAHFTGCSSIL